MSTRRYLLSILFVFQLSLSSVVSAGVIDGLIGFYSNPDSVFDVESQHSCYLPTAETSGPDKKLPVEEEEEEEPECD